MVNDEQTAVARTQNLQQEPPLDELASHIRNKISEFRRHRTSQQIDDSLLAALRTYRGKYSAEKLAEIKKFQGSDVYARVTAVKCRGTSSLLRDVYLSAERPWDLEPTPEPTVPEDINQSIQQLVSVEVATLQQAGQQVDQQMIKDRVTMLKDAAKRAAAKQADKDADRAGETLDDLLTEGGFYDALAEFLNDLPIFPYAVMKGPIVKRSAQVQWVDGQAQMTFEPKMFWQRVSPFDVWFSPGGTRVENCEVLERIKFSRHDLVSVRELPGYNKDAIDAILERFSERGLREWWSSVDQQRSDLEHRERSMENSDLIDGVEYHGSAQGKTLLKWGMDPSKITDPLEEYFIQAWLIDRWVVKVQINPSPTLRHIYYSTSFEKVPGTPYGNGLPNILEDIQDISNAIVRALVNNMSIASGPQVVMNDDMMAPTEDDTMFPWKRWHVKFDPMLGTSAAPITFFQPSSNAAELLGVYEKFVQMADEVSAIPRYMTGNEKVGGAGRTASGLAMMMSNASKVLQNVAANIDRDVIAPLLSTLYDMVMLTMPGVLRGDESIVVKGVNHAVKREQDRMRQLEFLQLTANPIDMSIMGPQGRANVLRGVSTNLGLDHEDVVPTDEDLRARMAAMQAMGGAPQPGGQGNQPPGPQDQRAGPEAVRQATGVEAQFANNGRAGSGTPSAG